MNLIEALENLTLALTNETGKNRDVTLTLDKDVIDEFSRQFHPTEKSPVIRTVTTPQIRLVKIHTHHGIVTLVPNET